MTSPPEGFRHLTPIQIRFADVDRLDHVNNAKYLTYIEQARIIYMDDQTEASGLERLSMIVAKQTIEYKLPLALSDKAAEVWTRCSRLGTKSFDMEHLILRSHDAAVAAMGTVVVVCYDYAEQNTVNISDEWRQYLKDYEPFLT